MSKRPGPEDENEGIIRGRGREKRQKGFVEPASQEAMSRSNEKEEEVEREGCSRRGQGRWRCGGQGKTCQGRWNGLPGSKWSEILKLGNPQQVSEEEESWHNVLTQRLFGTEVSFVAPPSDLGPLVEGLVHALNTLQLAATNPAAFSNLNIEAGKVEEEVNQCLSLLLTCGRNSKTESLLDGLRRIEASMGSLLSWSTSLTCPPSPFLHTWLEVRWCLLQLAQDDSCSDFGILTPLTLPCRSLYVATLIDLLHLAKVTKDKLPHTPPLLCPCIEEAWLGLVRMITLQGGDFWNLLLTACLEDHVTESAGEGEDSSFVAYSCCFHDPDLLMNVTAQLIHLIFNSNLDREKHMENLDKPMVKFLRTRLTSMEAGVHEARLRVLMQFVIELQLVAGPSLNLLDILVKYFTNPLRLGSNFRLSGSGLIEGGTSIPSSPKSWFHQLSSSSPPSSSSTSFTSFLHLLGNALRVWKGTKDYDRLCSRLFNFNLRPSKLADLSSEYSLHHMSSILLVLVACGQDKRAGTLIQQLVNAAQKPGGVQLHLAKQRIGLTLALVLVDQGKSTAEVASLVSGMVGEAVAEFKAVQYRESEKIGARRRMVELVAGWKVGLEEVIGKTRYFENGEEMLLGDWISTFLEVACEQEIASMCKTISRLLLRLRAEIPMSTTKILGVGPSAVVDALRRFLPSLRKRVSHRTAPLAVGEVLAEYSCLALELGDLGRVREEVKAVRPRKAGVDGIRISVPTLQQLAYFHKLTAHPKVVSEANMLLIHVASLTVHISPACPGHSELVETWQSVVKILNIEVGEENPKDRDLSRVAMDKCVRWGLKEALEGMVDECKVLVDKKGVHFNKPRAYRVSGWLVRHASTMLESSFLQSLHHIIAPYYAFAEDWKPKLEELSSLALALPDFMRGLASLEDFQSNTTAHRYLGEVLEIYMRVSQWPADNRHPFAFLLTAEVEEQVREVVLVKLLNLAKEGSHLKKNWSITNNVLKLIRSNVASSRVVMLQVQTIFYPFLLQLVGRNDSLVGDVKNPKMSALKLLFYLVQQESSSVLDWLKEHIVKDLRGDYLWNLLDGFAKMQPELGRSLIKPLQKEVDRIDQQRGGIPDQRLKNHLDIFETKVYELLNKRIQI